MMKKGFRVPPQGSKNEQFNELKTEISNLQMAGRISQMMTQQLMQSIKTMSNDLGSTLNQLYEAQYELLAIKKSLNLDPAELTKIANAQRLLDFNEASAKQDIKDNLIPSDVAGADSIITITSVATDEQGADKGFFRSRLKLSESGVPDLIANLVGKKVGDKVSVKLNGLDHVIELLDIRKSAAVEEAVSEVAH